MRWAALPSRVVGFGLLCLLLWLGLAAWPAAFVDRGSTGLIRISVFPLVLTLFDPFVWTCVLNSLIIAGLVTAGSLLIGVTVGISGSNSGYRGRTALWALGLIPIAAEPLLIAPAIGMLFSKPESWDWLAARSLMNYPLDDLVRWAALCWIGLSFGTPIIALTTASSLRKVEPSWLEAARLTGASRWRIWREIVWPILKPDVASALSAVFILSLIEPAGPLILGLNRTLATQIVDAAIRLDQPTRPACLALLAIAITALGRTLIGWWGGSDVVHQGHHRFPILERASFRAATVSRLILSLWIAFGVGPILFLATRSFQVLQLSASQGGLWASITDPELLGWLVNSAIRAGLALVIDLIILSSWIGRSPSDRGLKLASNFLRGVPPLALGVGAFATPWLLESLADGLGGHPGDGLRSVAREFNPARSPGFLLILVIAAAKWPMIIRVAELARGQTRNVLSDASKLMGTSDRRSNSFGHAGWFGVIPSRLVILCFVLGATNLAPALILTPFSERSSIAPAILQTFIREGAIQPRIAGLILMVLVIKMGAFALASRSKAGSIGDWYRG